MKAPPTVVCDVIWVQIEVLAGAYPPRCQVQSNKKCVALYALNVSYRLTHSQFLRYLLCNTQCLAKKNAGDQELAQLRPADLGVKRLVVSNKGYNRWT